MQNMWLKTSYKHSFIWIKLQKFDAYIQYKRKARTLLKEKTYMSKKRK